MMHVLSTLLIYSNLLFQKGISNISSACKFTSLLEVSVHQDLSPVWVGQSKISINIVIPVGTTHCSENDRCMCVHNSPEPFCLSNL
jgi:hypothetical protein